jgi:ABC-type lipoprotein export system ATPase subunit
MTSERNDPIVRTQALTRVYRVGTGRVVALDGADLTVRPGTLVALRGRSGSGKTTLLNCIGGLDRPSSGQVWFQGRELGAMSESERVRMRRRSIGFVFQSFALLPIYSAAENVSLMLRLAGVPNRERASRVKEVLSMVGLLKWADHRPYELSGGQQQRVAIARALSTRPPLILADEPTGELDSATGQQIWGIFREIVDREGCTVLIATHDLTLDPFADKVFNLEDGRIAM